MAASPVADAAATSDGPLRGLRVVEFASIGPGPYCAMLLADLGAEVLRVDRPGGNGWPNPIMDRGRASLTLDLGTLEGRERAAEIVALADVLVEGLRPGVMERLGLGPEAMLSRNPRLIYGRMTGWGQEGPLKRTAGHDINYIGLTGALAAIGKPGEPAIAPLNLLGDFGGGSLFLAFGIMAALWERQRSGKGQVVDAAIIDGVTSMMSMFMGLLPAGLISLDRGENFLGGAAPFYRCYRCADGREMSVGAIEPQFWRIICERLEAPDFVTQDRAGWAESISWLEATFAARPQAHWIDVFEGSDACVAPVLTLQEAQVHDHNRARQTFVQFGGLHQPAPSPRFSRTPGTIRQTLTGEQLLGAWSAAD